jgi:hypothetical protein
MATCLGIVDPKEKAGLGAETFIILAKGSSAKPMTQSNWKGAPERKRKDALVETAFLYIAWSTTAYDLSTWVHWLSHIAR